MILLALSLTASADPLGGYRTVHPVEPDQGGVRLAVSPDAGATTATQATLFAIWRTEQVAYRASVSGVEAHGPGFEDVGLGRFRFAALHPLEGANPNIGVEVAAGWGHGVAPQTFADAPRDALSGLEVLGVMELASRSLEHPTIFRVDLGFGGSPYMVVPIMGSLRLSKEISASDLLSFVLEGEVSTSFRPFDLRALVRTAGERLAIDLGATCSVWLGDSETSEAHPIFLVQVRWLL